MEYIATRYTITDQEQNYWVEGSGDSGNDTGIDMFDSMVLG